MPPRTPNSTPEAPGPATPEAPPEAPRPGFGSPPPSSAPLGPSAPARSPSQTPQSLLQAADRSEWWHWWEYHRELYLELDRTLSLLQPRTPSDDPAAAALEGRRFGLSSGAVYGRIVPVLHEVLEEHADDSRMVRQTLLALGRMGEAPDAMAGRSTHAAILPFLADGNMGVVEGATIALGALASPEAVLTLRGLLLDDEQGRELAGGKVPVRVRALAAYGLGMSGGVEAPPAVRRYAVHALARALGSDVARYPDVQAAAVIALGLVPVDGLAAEGQEALPPAAGLDAQVDYLLEVLRDERGERMTRTHAPTALARLLVADPEGTAAQRGAVVESLLALTHPRSRGRVELVRSAVVAMGEFADADGDEDDRAMRDRLADLMKRGDVPTRRFATMALARCAGRKGAGAEPWAGVEDATRVFTRSLSRGKDREKPWSGLALGVLGYHLRQEGERLDDGAVKALHHTLGKVRQPMDAAALSLGAGLVYDPGAFDLIRERVEDTSDPQALAHLTLALGLLRERTGIHVLEAIMDESGHKPAVMEAAALGRAMMIDRELVGDLVERLDDCGCATSTRGVCRGLAWAGDQRAVTPLLQMVGDEDLSSGTRANAIEALGRVADRSAVPWDVRISAGLNYLDAPASLTDPTGYGILDTF